MARPIQLILAFLIGGVLFIAGIFLGRQFPAHHFERFGQAPLVIDTTTGKVCSPARPVNLLDQGMETPSYPPGFVPDTSSSPYPPCGK